MIQLKSSEPDKNILTLAQIYFGRIEGQNISWAFISSVNFYGQTIYYVDKIYFQRQNMYSKASIHALLRIEEVLYRRCLVCRKK